MLGVSHRASLYVLGDDRVTARPQEMQSKMPVVEQFSTGPPEEPCWWAVYTRHQHEKTMEKMLSGKGIEVFLPLFESARHRKDRNKQLSLPLFLCYLFVREGHDRRLQVVTTPDVHILVTNGEGIARIPEAEIHAIRTFLKCGQRVRVKRGPLTGIEGILARKRNQDRLILCGDAGAVRRSRDLRIGCGTR